MMVYLNKDISAALKVALDAKGEGYVYEDRDNCVYAVDGQPSCIVGHVLKVLDPLAFEMVVQFEGDRYANKGDTSFGNVASRLKLRFDDEQLTALKRLQREQDGGTPWGSAVATEWIGALGERLPDSVPDGMGIHGEES